MKLEEIKQEMTEEKELGKNKKGEWERRGKATAREERKLKIREQIDSLVSGWERRKRGKWGGYRVSTYQ